MQEVTWSSTHLTGIKVVYGGKVENTLFVFTLCLRFQKPWRVLSSLPYSFLSHFHHPCSGPQNPKIIFLERALRSYFLQSLQISDEKLRPNEAKWCVQSAELDRWGAGTLVSFLLPTLSQISKLASAVLNPLKKWPLCPTMPNVSCYLIPVTWGYIEILKMSISSQKPIFSQCLQNKRANSWGKYSRPKSKTASSFIPIIQSNRITCHSTNAPRNWCCQFFIFLAKPHLPSKACSKYQLLHEYFSCPYKSCFS